jgi:Zn ribbon nucleic-acid-binding protein
MSLRDRIVEIIEEEGLSYKERQRTIYTMCPQCNQDDKLSILKDNGATICYRGSCNFKGWFEDWLSLTAQISTKEARERFRGQARMTSYDIEEDEEEAPKGPEPIEWPLDYLVPIGSQIYPEGRQYLEGRGIPQAVAERYGILYAPDLATRQLWGRRVYIPIIRSGKVYGFQARAIDPVPSNLRMLNNEGFPRAFMLMFEDKIKACDHVIICEGPITALKFDRCGGNVATMGKVVTEGQLEIIRASRPKRVYVALDDDAAPEIMKLVKQFMVPVYWVDVPESARQRCQASGKKADFGECTFDECVQAIKDSQLVDETFLVI